MESYKILLEPNEAELVEKKSRFLASIKPVTSEQEALAFVEENRKQYWDASHHCSAFVIGERNELQRCSDDGEPGQTAGRPMLDVLLGEDIHNVCVVVTRYFGGTLLGTGGLVRAYGGAVKLVLEDSKIIIRCVGERLRIGTDYTGVGKIQYLAGQMGLRELESSYTDRVELTYLVPSELADTFKQQITEATSGRGVMDSLGTTSYGIFEKELYLNV